MVKKISDLAFRKSEKLGDVAAKLANANPPIAMISQLANISRKDLGEIPGVGEASVFAVCRALEDAGFPVSDDFRGRCLPILKTKISQRSQNDFCNRVPRLSL